MKSKLLTSTLIASAILMLFVGSLPMVFGYSTSATTTSNGVYFTSGQPTVPSTLTKVPVTLSFSPKTISVVAGKTGKNTMAITNKGSTSVTFTSCQFFYKLSSQTTYKKGTCSLGGKSLTVKGGQTLKITWTTTTSTSTPKGTYNIKVDLTNSVDISGPGYYTLTVT
jgi:hypothetical protein